MEQRRAWRYDLIAAAILLALPLGTRGGQLETASRIKQWMETAEREPKSTLASIADRCLEMLSDEERAISRAVEHLIIEAIRNLPQPTQSRL